MKLHGTYVLQIIFAASSEFVVWERMSKLRFPRTTVRKRKSKAQKWVFAYTLLMNFFPVRCVCHDVPQFLADTSRSPEEFEWSCLVRTGEVVSALRTLLPSHCPRVCPWPGVSISMIVLFVPFLDVIVVYVLVKTKKKKGMSWCTWSSPNIDIVALAQVHGHGNQVY